MDAKQSGTRGKNVRQIRIEADDDGVRLDRWFQRHMPELTFGEISRWARTGQLRVNGKRAQVSDRLVAGQSLRLPPVTPTGSSGKAHRRIEISDEDRQQALEMVIHKDRAALVLNKPPGLATQGGTKTTSHVDGLLDAFRDEDDDPRPRLVHRLDKDTSGILLVARTPGSAAFFSKRFSGRTARKVYWALVMGVPGVREGQIDLPLAKQPGTGGEKMHVDEENGQTARTRYRVLEQAGTRCAWVELQPLTGRTHQLRVHMAAIGHPIVGDGKYAGQDAYLTGSISRKLHLHARRLVMEHPDGGRIDEIANLPEHFAASMESLGFDASLADANALTDDAPQPGRAGQKQKAKAHAKQVRKERRGERRKRDTAPIRKPRAKTTGKPKGPARGKSGPEGKGRAR